MPAKYPMFALTHTTGLLDEAAMTGASVREEPRE
jgi:hypothetical protein